MAQRRSGLARRLALLALPAIFFVVFFGYPVWTMIGLGLDDDGWSGVVDVWTSAPTRRVVWFTIWQAALSTVATVGLGLCGAYVFARLRFAGKRVLAALITVPFVLPTVVVAAAFLALLGRGGVLDDLFGVRLDRTVAAIVLAHIFFNYAVVVRTVGSLWAQLDRREVAAARVLGATPWQAFRRITLPQLWPAVVGAALIVFLFSFTSFGVIQVLGGPHFATVEVEIYRQTAQLLELQTAAALSVLQLAAVVAMVALHGWLARDRQTPLRLVPVVDAALAPRGAPRWIVLYGNLAIITVLLLAPLLVLIERSFATPAGYGWSNYRALFQHDDQSTLFVPAASAIGNSLGFAALATLIATVVGGLAAAGIADRGGRFTRVFDGLLMLPLGISAVTVGFGFLITLDEPPLDLRSSIWLIPLAQALVAVPFVVRILVPTLRAIDGRLREAAAVLGASRWQAWRAVELPLLWRPLLVAAGFAGAISLGEFGATLFIARPDAPTVPVAIFRLLGRPGEVNYGQAMALSVVLMALCTAVFLLVDRLALPGTTRRGGR